MINQIGRNVIYDKFLMVEGLAYSGKKLVEAGRLDKAQAYLTRLIAEVDLLKILLKMDPAEATDGSGDKAQRVL